MRVPQFFFGIELNGPSTWLIFTADDRLPSVKRFGTVAVSGLSMAPTYSDGDWLFVRWFHGGLAKISLNDVVVIERGERPGIFLIKRLQKKDGDTFWVQGDNFESSDSRTWGWIPESEIVGKALFRFRKGKK